MIIIPKKWNFASKGTEINVSWKKAEFGESTLVVKRIKDKFCVSLFEGDHSIIGVTIFGTSNERDAIEACEEAAIKAKIAKRQ